MYYFAFLVLPKLSPHGERMQPMPRPDVLRNAIETELDEFKDKLVQTRKVLQADVDDQDVFWSWFDHEYDVLCSCGISSYHLKDVNCPNLIN